MTESGKNISCKKNVSENPTHSTGIPQDDAIGQSYVSESNTKQDFLKKFSEDVDNSPYREQLRRFFFVAKPYF